MPEARLENLGSGLTPVTHGWFVGNVRDAEWWSSDGRGARCAFENEYGDPPVEFEQLGFNVTVLEPGQFTLYHDILARVEPDRELYLAVTATAYEDVFHDPIGELLLANGRLKLLVFDAETEVIQQWTPKPPTVT